jgi:hypothetical protein
MNSEFVTKLYDRLVRLGYSLPEDIKGCSVGEVEKLQTTYNVKLPKSYIDFLLKFGHSAGDFFKGNSIFYRSIDHIQKASKDLMEECNITLPENAFFFYFNQGYECMFFVLNSEDPPVFHFSESYSSPKKISESFSKFMYETLEQDIAYSIRVGTLPA